MPDRLGHPAAVGLRLLGGVRVLGDDPVDDARLRAGRGAHRLLGGHLGARSGVRRSPRRPRGSGDSHECWAQTTRSAGIRASAPPPVPCPSSTQTVGTGSTTSSARQRAISPAMPPSSASLDRAAPAVSMTLTSGSPSSVASFILAGDLQPRRPERGLDPLGATVLPEHDARHPLELRHGEEERLRSHSPAPVPNSGTTSLAPSLSSARTPFGRSGSRERVTDSHAGTSASGSWHWAPG